MGTESRCQMRQLEPRRFAVARWDAMRAACPVCVPDHFCDQHSEYLEIIELRAKLSHQCGLRGSWTTTPPTEPGFYWFCDTGCSSHHADGTADYLVHFAMLHRPYKDTDTDPLRVVQCGADMHDEWSPVSDYINIYWLGPIIVPDAPVTPPPRA